MGNVKNAITTDEALAGKSTNEIFEETSEEKENYYVYEYFSDRNGEIENTEGKIVHISKGDVYYVGKGINNRVTSGIRNNECEKFKRELGFNYRIVKSGMCEKDALLYEKEKIQEYLEAGIYLTNVLSGSIEKTDENTMGMIKYLVKLCEANIISMSNRDIALEIESNPETVAIFRNKEEKGEDIEEIIPDNLSYFLDKYDYDNPRERDLKYCNIKYVLDMAEKGVIKATQAQIAEYYEESSTVISCISKNKYKSVRKPIKPNDLEEILVKFNPNNVTEEERNKGCMMYIIKNLIEKGILKMTVKDLVRETKNIYGINAMQIADIKRSGQRIKLFKPDGEIFAMLFSKYYFPD